MKLNAIKTALFLAFSLLFIYPALSQIDTPQKRIDRIHFLHQRIFEIDETNKYVENPTFSEIIKMRDSVAIHFPSTINLVELSTDTKALQWATSFDKEADAYITILESYIRSRKSK